MFSISCIISRISFPRPGKFVFVIYYVCNSINVPLTFDDNCRTVISRYRTSKWRYVKIIVSLGDLRHWRCAARAATHDSALHAVCVYTRSHKEIPPRYINVARCIRTLFSEEERFVSVIGVASQSRQFWPGRYSTTGGKVARTSTSDY